MDEIRPGFNHQYKVNKQVLHSIITCKVTLALFNTHDTINQPSIVTSPQSPLLHSSNMLFMVAQPYITSLKLTINS